MKRLIVTRHQGLVDWLKLRGIEGDVIAHATPDDVRGRDVYGVLPLWLSAEAHTVTEVSLPGMPADRRGTEATPNEMDEWGGKMATYTVTVEEK